jgi:2-dehydropantoate 2-reductase
MKILVLGAGAVGGYFGGRLAQAGADVTFLVRPARAALMAQHGLRVSSKLGDLRMPVKCVTQDQLTPDYHLAILTAKAYDLAGAIEAVAPGLGTSGKVLPLLNGMSHLDALDHRFGKARVLGGVAYIASTLAPDGEIRHLNDVHRLAFGARDPDPSQEAVCAALAEACRGATLEAIHSPDIAQAMWDKWVFLASLAGMCCLMRAPVGDIVQAPSGERLMLAMLEECAAVARAEGHPVSDKMMANYRGQLTQKGSLFAASMLRDAESGGRTEADHILGNLLVRAGRHGQSAPMLELACVNMQAYAARRAREAGA